jgi:hypothetical protein
VPCRSVRPEGGAQGVSLSDALPGERGGQGGEGSHSFFNRGARYAVPLCCPPLKYSVVSPVVQHCCGWGRLEKQMILVFSQEVPHAAL